MTGFWELLSRFGSIFVWWTVIAPWEAGIRVRFGKSVTLLLPGVHFRIPYFDAVFKQTVRLRITTLQLQTVSTRDGKVITLLATIAYRIADLAKLYDTLHHPEETIRNLVATEIAKIVRDHDLDSCTPELIEREADAKLDLEKYGLQSAGVKIVDFAVCRAIRLLQDERWFTGETLETVSQSKAAV